MNFLLRQSPSSAAAPPPPPPSSTNTAASINLPPISPWLTKTTSQGPTTLEGLIAGVKSQQQQQQRQQQQQLLQQQSLDRQSFESSNRESFASEDGGSLSSANLKDLECAPLDDKHVDVVDDEGWITIPFKKLPEDWDGAPDIQSFHSLDRSFVFPGEQVHILACLSASKQDSEILTPFRLAALMNENGHGQGSKDRNGSGNVSEEKSASGTQRDEEDEKTGEKSVKKHQRDVSESESYFRMEDHKKQTQTLLQRFKDSHFFVRIAEAGEQLWSDRNKAESSESGDDSDGMENNKTAGSRASISAVIDSGRFDARASGGVARNSVKCCSLENGDVVVLLQVNVGVDSLKDPILEILQFEKHHDRTTVLDSDIPVEEEHSPCGDLLKWLLPLDNSQLPINRPLSPPIYNSSHKTSFSAASGSQLFSFGHFRSYSMSSLPQNSPSASQNSPAASSKPKFDLEDWNRFGTQKSQKSSGSGNQGLVSFRGVALEPERFSVCCGLEGIYIPGRRWRKQLEIIQPVDIHSFAANCNTDDLLCVQIKNICPNHVPDIVVYIDAITIILEEASKSGQPLSVPVACIEAGTNHSLPNLALRRGEEHSFILKPAISVLKKSKIPDDRNTKSHSKAGNKATIMRLSPVVIEGTKNISTSHKYAILVSCRCNYSESRLFFKKPTDWRPRISRDFMISVASEISKQTEDVTGEVSQLPVQVLTLQASNLTSEDLTMTLLAPASITIPPSVLSLNSAPSTPRSPFGGFSTTQLLSTVTRHAETQIQSGAQSLSSDQQAVQVSDVIPTTPLSCTHLWLHSRVPLGCVPSQSTAKIKLELLPLTDGIITLDTLQIHVKEKGLTYIPEHALKINATSSIATGII